MSESESFVPEEARLGAQNEAGQEQARGQERIEGGIWRPGILDKYSEEVGAAASTKDLRRTDEIALRILGDVKRFERPMQERIRAGRILAELRNDLSPDVDLHNIVKSQLAHTGKVQKIDEGFVADLVKGKLPEKQILRTDGLVTNLEGYPLYISAADCYPVGIYDPENKAIGVFHNGVHGLVEGITDNGIATMAKEYNSKPENLVVTLAPGISRDYFIPPNYVATIRRTFGEDMEEFLRPPEGVEPSEENKGWLHFDLQSAIVKRLVAAGIKRENIEISQYHTDTHNEYFPSERVEKDKRDSFGFMMVLK